MKTKLKSLDEQVMVITGATSGIGLVTARMAAKKGARLVLVARSEGALRQLTDELNAAGGEAIYVVADVGKEDDIKKAADAAIEHFGGFDTWVNDAGVSIYGKLLDVPVDDMRRLFDTNVWGVIHGSLVAARHLKLRGGAIINVGSTLSDRAIPLQGGYSASKHAVKGFTDSLRMELEAEGAPVSVTLIKPGSIDTPYTKHAKNYLASAPNLPPPVYAPEVVAEAILHCATHPQRDVFAGGGGKGWSWFGMQAPRWSDVAMRKSMIKLQHSDQPAGDLDENGLYRPFGELQERGQHPGHVAKRSYYTKASLHPLATAAVVACAAGLTVAGIIGAVTATSNATEAKKRRARARKPGFFSAWGGAKTRERGRYVWVPARKAEKSRFWRTAKLRTR